MTRIVCLNVGSSSIKAASFDAASTPSDVTVRELRRAALSIDIRHPYELHDVVAELDAGTPDVVAHRVVHGGPVHDGPAVVDAALIAELIAVTPLAPLHMQASLELISAAQALYPNALHVACFDTAFHRSMPDVAKSYALPRALTGTLVQRYGFHGLSCAHVVEVVDPSRMKRAVVAHLGSGSSLTAIRDGKSIDNMMGFTPTGGIVMGTRPGDLDPGVLTYLVNQGHSVEYLHHVFNFESGLLALGGSADMRQLLQRCESDHRAQLAIDVYGYRIAQQIGAYAVSLGGLDTVVFTGGIGEHSSVVREIISARVSPLFTFETVVVAANEEHAMARQANFLR